MRIAVVFFFVSYCGLLFMFPLPGRSFYLTPRSEAEP